MVKGIEKEIEDALIALKKGGIIVFPTDTAYGLGCDATDAAAVRRIFRSKGREPGKALPIIVSDELMAKKFFKLETHHSKLTTRHWPGPLSIILTSRGKIVDAALDRGTAAVRVPDHKIARELARRLGRPIVATSANVSGQPPAYSIKALTLAAPPDRIINGGVLPRRKPSTIVRVDADGTVEVLREGPIKI